jgi:hypothetical protein
MPDLDVNWFFGLPMAVVFGLIFAALVVATEIGFRVGKRLRHSEKEPARQETGALQASVLGLLALFLGFTYSASTSRFEERRLLTVKESNAIGTAFLRADLLPDPAAERVREILKRYTDLRLRGDAAADRQAEALAAEVWTATVEHARQEASPVAALGIASVNDLIDAYGERQAALGARVPRQVFIMLGILALMAMALTGYSCGVIGYRALGATSITAALIAAVIVLTLDLHEARQGLIRDNLEPLKQLRASMK